MANIVNPPTFRYPFTSELADQPIGVQNAHRAAFQGLQDAVQAITALNTKVSGLSTTSSAATASTTETVNSFTQTVIAAATIIGKVNNQTGVTAYTTQQSDYGAFIILDDASPIAVTLAGMSTNPGLVLPWYTIIINAGTGAATLTPPSGGQIDGNPTFVLSGGNEIIIAYDGTNFFVQNPSAAPENTPAVAHKFFNAYNSATGAFGDVQPAASDISGLGTAATQNTTGAGAAIPTGPTTSVSGDIVSFTGTAGQIADSGIASSNLPLLNATNSFTGANSFTRSILFAGTTSSSTSVSVTALSTATVLTGSGSTAGLLALRDNTIGGSALFLVDPNGGAQLLGTSQITGMASAADVNFNGTNWTIQLTTGPVPRAIAWGIYGA